MEKFPNKKDSELFSKQKESSYAENSLNPKELLQKELDVNRAEQRLLKKRVDLMKEFANDLPSSDPQYSMLLAQIQMDRIEIDELKAEEELLIEKISNQ